MPKRSVVILFATVTLLVPTGWWLFGWYQQSVTDERLLERLEQLIGKRDWKVTAVREDAGFVTTQELVLHNGEVMRSSDETPGRTGTPHYIVKNGKFYSLIHDYEVFESRQTVPRAFIEADLATVSTKPPLVAALAAMRESFPLHYTLLALTDHEAFFRSVARADTVDLGNLWRRESEHRYVQRDGRLTSSHIPRVIEFLESDTRSPTLRLEYFNETGYAGPGPSVKLTFTPVDNLDEALRFPADYVRVEAW